MNLFVVEAGTLSLVTDASAVQRICAALRRMGYRPVVWAASEEDQTRWAETQDDRARTIEETLRRGILA